MKAQLKRLGLVVSRPLKTVFDTIAVWVVAALFRGLRRADRKRIANGAARFMRHVGPWLPEHRVGRANLAAAFPEKSPAEIETILLGAWENLGRVAAEFAHLDRPKI